MKRRSRLWWVAIGAVFVGLGSVSRGQGQSQQDGEFGEIPDRYIVLLKAGTSPAAVSNGHGLTPDFVYSTAVNGFAGTVPPGRLRALQNDSRVEAVIPDRVVSALGKPGGGGGGAGQVVPAGVQRIGANNVAYTGDGVGVAVMDTGLDFNHNDLKPLGSASFSAFGGSAQDGNGHGTHVGGIIAARNNAIDVVGVAPNATLYAVKVLDNAGNGSDATVMEGLDWIADNANTVFPPIRVVNMSLGRAGSIGDNPALRQAVQKITNSPTDPIPGLGITVVVSAGNDCNLEISQQVPAAYPEVMAVSSTTAADGTNSGCKFFSGVIKADTASYFTTDGTDVAVAAPGEDKENVTKSCFISSVGVLSTKLGGGTTRMSGTSQAAPHMAGVVALLYAQAGGTLDPEYARSKIKLGADRKNVAPLNSPTSCYTFDGTREGVLYAPGALAAP